MTRTNNLETFLDSARNRVAVGYYAPRNPELKSNGSFLQAILGETPGIIAELKPRSPSEGRLINGRPEEILRAYRIGGAKALSILADPDHFDGGKELVELASVTGLPILWKDFVVDEAQLDCARSYGASAVLLIESCFELTARREQLVAMAHQRGLEVLLECHSQVEVTQALDSKADLLGVNARNLRTLEIDSQMALQIISRFSGHRKIALLSGVESRSDVQAAKQSGAVAVLVGSKLMKSASPALALASLQRPLVKVCGIRNSESLRAAKLAGADLVGFVVGAPSSPRNLSTMAASSLRDEARDFGLGTVLVTPHADEWEVREWVRIVKPNFVQTSALNPDESYVHSLHNWGAQWLQVCTATSQPSSFADGYVFDTESPFGGGTGTTHDWSDSAEQISRLGSKMTLIAGGLDSKNVADALRATDATGADASSKLETSPGIKSEMKIFEFVKAARNVKNE